MEAGEHPMDSFEYSVLVSILGEGALAMENRQNIREKEQAALRKEYIESIRGNMRGQLNSILIKEKDGSITDLGKKYGGVTDTKN